MAFSVVALNKLCLLCPWLSDVEICGSETFDGWPLSTNLRFTMCRCRTSTARTRRSCPSTSPPGQVCLCDPARDVLPSVSLRDHLDGLQEIIPVNSMGDVRTLRLSCLARVQSPKPCILPSIPLRMQFSNAEIVFFLFPRALHGHARRGAGWSVVLASCGAPAGADCCHRQVQQERGYRRQHRDVGAHWRQVPGEQDLSTPLSAASSVNRAFLRLCPRKVACMVLDLSAHWRHVPGAQGLSTHCMLHSQSIELFMRSCPSPDAGSLCLGLGLVRRAPMKFCLGLVRPHANEGLIHYGRA